MKRTLIYKLEFKIFIKVIINLLLSILTMVIMYIMWKGFIASVVERDQFMLDKLFMLRQEYDFRLIAIIVWGIVFIVYCHIFLYKKIKYYVEIDEHMKSIANGSIDQKVPEKQKEEIGKLACNINAVMDKLNDAVDEQRRAEQTKYDLITNVSHDLRTPLTSILGYLELIDKDKYKDEVELRYYINIAYEKSKRLNVLISDLFEYTTMRNNTLKVKKEPINIVELLNQVALEFRLLLRNANMECRTYFSDDKLVVIGDAVKVARAFENLISNAMKYGKGTEYIDIVTRKEDKHAVIEIINYGDSIPSIDIPFIFDRFYRVEKSRSEATGGSGLGLAITKNIIELHEGEISVESNYDRTAFIIKLPLDETVNDEMKKLE